MLLKIYLAVEEVTFDAGKKAWKRLADEISKVVANLLS